MKEGDEWINNLDKRGRPQRLLHISSIDDAYRRADKDMGRKTNALRSQFSSAAVGFEEGEKAGHIRTVKVFDNGYRFVQLLTPHALDLETVMMGHCIGLGDYDDKVILPEKYQYYSLRDPLNGAHATLEVSNGVLQQSLGQKNVLPLPKYFDVILDFVREKQFALIPLVGLCWYVASRWRLL